MSDIRTFIDWLSYHPTSDDIARALVTEYLATCGACCLRIGRLHSNDDLEFLGEYGFDSGRERQRFKSNVWRSWDHDEAWLAQGERTRAWDSTKTLLMMQLRERGMILGFLVIRFSNPIEDTDFVEEIILSYTVILGLYLSLVNTPERDLITNIAQLSERGTEQLTPRQFLILRGMVEGKTNHELANELGFSVSTIRHETMRIYQSLGVSDRKEAAKKALLLALIEV